MGASRPRVISEPTHTLEGGVVAICSTFTRSDFKDSILGSVTWKQALIQSDFKVLFLW